MPNSRLFRAVLVVALILATSPLASAAEIIIGVAPPAPVVETAPPGTGRARLLGVASGILALERRALCLGPRPLRSSALLRRGLDSGPLGRPAARLGLDSRPLAPRLIS